MATQPKTTGLTYGELQAFPNDNLRRELIDGELIVTPAPATRHQAVVAKLVHRLYAHCEAHGGQVFPAPTDVYFAEDNVLQPDVLFVGPEHAARVEEKFVRNAPDLVVEVSSPSTRHLGLVRKRDLYERYGVPEYWYVDLDADRVEVYLLKDERYGRPTLFVASDVIESSAARGFSIAVDDLLSPPQG